MEKVQLSRVEKGAPKAFVMEAFVKLVKKSKRENLWMVAVSGESRNLDDWGQTDGVSINSKKANNPPNQNSPGLLHFRVKRFG